MPKKIGLKAIKLYDKHKFWIEPVLFACCVIVLLVIGSLIAIAWIR